ncbi:alpha-L-fucosidase [Amycolatopsis samaneae]|uniref:alpha-L-fucosidase n=1 Tax=Amycolatopsis samaneae TaxID=664691 RepID=A0ABW5GX90_9PSEU
MIGRTLRRGLVAALAAAAALSTPVTAAEAAPVGTVAAAEPGPGTNYATDDPFTSPRTQWWRDDRFGMFIHFGAYSQLQGSYTRADGTVCHDAEWIKRQCGVPMDQYETIASQFNPKDFDAAKIVAAAKSAGQKYIVQTAKHHEGYAMWPTRVNTWNLRDHSSFDRKRDILAEMKTAADKAGIAYGLYYSIWDWHDPDFANPATFPKYKARMYAQLKELVDNYHPKILWFDGEWNTDNPVNNWSARDGEELQTYVRSLDPSIVINNRVGKRRVTDGDTGTPEQEIPAAPVDGQLWESCMTLNDHWGFAEYDHNWKSAEDLTRKLLSIASRSGNYLLNIGPDRYGAVPAESIDRLKAIGDWQRTAGQGRAIAGAGSPGVVAEPSWGVVSRKGDKLYASVFQWPGAGKPLTLDALAPFDVTGARVLGSAQRVTAVRDRNKIVLTPSGSATNPTATEIELSIRTPRPAAVAGTGLTARFWPNATFSGEPTVSRVDPTVNYSWKFGGSPAPSVPSGTFSSRWTGQLTPGFSEDYTITAISDDTVKVWIDGRLVIDNSTPHDATIDKASVRLLAGQWYPIKVEQTQQGGESTMKLLWSGPDTPQRIIPAANLYPES